MLWTSSGRTLDVTGRAAIVGVLNVTPDSYFDGGKYDAVDAAVLRAQDMIAEGADVIDIGGESTGPGSKDVSSDEERQRVLPVVTAVREACPAIWISVDTVKADIARDALAAGADMINDVSAGRHDKEMFGAIAGAGCPVVLMYAKDATPRTTIENTSYDDVIARVHDVLARRKDAAVRDGIDPQCIIVDPGLGHFISSDPRYSWEILRNLDRFSDLGPVFVSPSRKSFLAGPHHLPPSDRLEATLAATGIALAHGARFIRTHDVAVTVRVRDAVSLA